MKTLILATGLLLCLSLSGCGWAHAITHTNAFSAPTGQTSVSAPAAPAQATKPADVVKAQVKLMWVVSVLLLLAAGGMAYLQNYFLAIKLGLAGLLLPIFAVLWSLYWGWIVAAVLVGIAVVVFLHYKVVLMPWVRSLESKIAPPKPPSS